MKITEPVLFPISVNELEVLRICADNNIKDCDIFLNYNYQLTHYRLYMDYVDPSLQKECLKLVNHMLEIEDGMLFTDFMPPYLKRSVYKDYHLLFLCKFLSNNNKKSDNYTQDFKDWLKTERDYTYKMGLRPNLIFEIRRNYNSIVIPRLWHTNTGNLFNVIHDYSANYFSQREVLKTAGEHLIEGGKIHLYDKKDYGRLLFSLDGDYREVQKNVLQKKAVPHDAVILKRDWAKHKL